MKKRVLSILFTVCMVMSMLPINAFATNGNEAFKNSGVTDSTTAVCINHQTHDENCGYETAVARSICTHGCENCSQTKENEHSEEQSSVTDPASSSTEEDKTYDSATYFTAVNNDHMVMFGAMLPTVTEYLTENPATANTDYVLNTSAKTLYIKTAKGAAWWSASGASYLAYKVYLDADIDVSDFLWSPVGVNEGSPFTGIFDGQGCNITGLVISGNMQYAGIFGAIRNATIKNVGLVSSSIDATHEKSTDGYAGSIAALAQNATIANCYNGASINLSTTNANSWANVGGIVGFSDSGAVKNCYSFGNLTATATRNYGALIGGIIGDTMGEYVTALENCFFLESDDHTTGMGIALTDEQMKGTPGSPDVLIDKLNTWVNSTASTGYYSWKTDNSTTPVNGGYPVFGSAWAEPQAQWGMAGAENAAPTTWGGSGSLTDAVAYANGLASGTAYIKLLYNVDATATLKFAAGKTTVLDLNGKTIDGNRIPAGSGVYRNVLTVNGNLTLCDSSTDTVANQGKITGGHGSGDGLGGGVYVHFSGTFIMTGGNITGNTAVNGGGVGSYGTFTMTGGSIADNSSISGSATVSCGGGVMNSGYFNMSGGSITGNTVVDGGAGGGVIDFGGGITLSGDVNISGNTVGTASSDVALMSVGSGTAVMNIAGALTNSTAIGISIVDLSDDVFIPKTGVFTSGEAVTNSDYISKFVSDNSDFAVIAAGSQLKLAAAQAITKADATNGSFIVKVNGNEISSALEGQTVTIIPTASSGYTVDTVTVKQTASPYTAVTVSSNSFTMPAYPVTISVTFKVPGSIGTGEITGTVTDSTDNVVSGAVVKIMRGATTLASTTTDASGIYGFGAVAYGTYSLVVEKDAIKVTKIIEIKAASTTGNVKLPIGKSNTEVKTEANTPPTAAEGLNELFDASNVGSNTDDTKGITTDDITAITNGGSVTVTLTSEKKSESEVQADANAIKAVATGKQLMLLDFTLSKVVTPNGGAPGSPIIMTELPSVLEIVVEIPESLRGAQSISVYRVHNNTATKFADAADGNGEYAVRKGNYMHIYAKNFSTYALGYEAYDVTISRGGTGASGFGSYMSGDTVTISAGSKSGYRFSGWTVTAGTASLADPTAARTTFTMPSDNVTVTANWTYSGGSTGGGSSTTYYTITATAGAGGEISTDKYVSVAEGDSAGFTFTPNKGYQIVDVLVNGRSVGAVKNYTFTNVRSNQTIEVTFKVSRGHVNPQTGVAFEDDSKNDWFAGTFNKTFTPFIFPTRGMIATELWRMEKNRLQS